jgi:hypothetical protein
VEKRVNDCAQRIVKEPVRSQADLMLLAEVTYWRLHSDPTGLWTPEAKARLAGEP